MEKLQELKKQNEQYRKRIFELKRMGSYKVWNENLRLVLRVQELEKENARLKASIGV